MVVAIKDWKIPDNVAVQAFINAIKSKPKGTIIDVAIEVIRETRNLDKNKAYKDMSDDEVLEHFKEKKLMQNLKVRIQNRTNTNIKLTAVSKAKSEKTAKERELLLQAGAEDKESQAYKDRIAAEKAEREAKKANR